MFVTTLDANPYWPTGVALGDFKNPSARFDAADTRTAASATPPTSPIASVFQVGTKRSAVIHRIFVAVGAATSTVKLVSAQATGEDLTPAYSAVTTGTLYDFTPGVIVPGGFAVVMAGGSSTVHIIYSLLEN